MCHAGNTEICCELCGHICNKNNYALHMYETHGVGKKPETKKKKKVAAVAKPSFMCAKCPRKFSLKKGLESHVSLVHEGKVGMYSCPHKCGRTFNHQSGIASHVINMHSDHFKYHCGVCGKKFKVIQMVLRNVKWNLCIICILSLIHI